MLSCITVLSGFSDDHVTIIPNPHLHSVGSTRDYWSDSLNEDHMEARIVSCYAGGHAQRRCDPTTEDQGCDSDDETAADLLQEWGWTAREQEFRERSRDLVTHHWAEIVAVATELLLRKTLDDTDVELIADAAAGTAEFIFGSLAADLARYRWLKSSASDHAENGGA